MIPREYISTFSAYLLVPTYPSGARYSGVPMVPFSNKLSSMVVASPKSPNLIFCFFLSKNILAGFKSL